MREIWNSYKTNPEDVDNGKPVVAVAVDKDKGSQVALKWAMDNLLTKGQTVTLVHVKTKHSSNPNMSVENYAKEIFLSFRCLCSRKDVHCNGVVLEEEGHYNGIVSRAINEFLSQNALEKMVLSAPVRSAFGRFRSHDIHTNILKGAPDFCTVYVISKGKVSSCRNAVRNAPGTASFRHPAHGRPEAAIPYMYNGMKGESISRSSFDEKDCIRSPFSRRGLNGKSYGELSLPETDISFVSSGRPSTDRILPSLYEEMESQRSCRLLEEPSCFERSSFDIMRTPCRLVDAQAMVNEYSHRHPPDNGATSTPQTMDSMEAEMRRLKLELKQTMDMYSTACREALTAKQKAGELHRWKMEEEIRLQEARLAEEAALAMAEKEKAKCKAALEAAEAAQRIAEMEAQRRINAEKKALKEAEERKKAMNSFGHNDLRYRRYTIEEIEVATEYFSTDRKIGEGGYGPVYECHLDHTQVAIKVLRPDAAQGQSQFHQEIEVLSCIRHPNMVLLLGACPEYGCLVYEYMANGSLEDRLFRRGNTPVLPWQLRFRIAAEIGTGLLFLHQTKPEPLVHRDLKPANILLDRNYVSKISDVGLARLVPPSVADSVTQYRLTSTAGTFCYIDPEYQQTGMLGIKSDIYSLGVLLVQIITGKPPMGLTHHVQRAIDRGSFKEMLDPAVQDWPVEEALSFAKLALKCAELRRKDRPDLGAVILPELQRLRELAEDNMYHGILGGTNANPSSSTQNNVCASPSSDQVATTESPHHN